MVGLNMLEPRPFGRCKPLFGTLCLYAEQGEAVRLGIMKGKESVQRSDYMVACHTVSSKMFPLSFAGCALAFCHNMPQPLSACCRTQKIAQKAMR